ncbi:MAG: DUF6770 family protein [Chitinophagaceae bacterium]
MKKFLIFFAVLFFTTSMYAQSKVFKEVSDDITTESKAIFSGRSVIGYVVFSQLEKANQDSFNYRITIMDENLNDIGVVNFREIGLSFEGTSFENDVLCLGYLKSTEMGKDYTKSGQVKNLVSKDFVMTQFINLEGKILNTQIIPVSTSGNFDKTNIGIFGTSHYIYNTRLKKGLQLEALAGTGFLLFYGDDKSSNVVNYNFEGKQIWSSKMPDAESYYLNTAGANIYLLMKNTTDTYGDFSFTSIDANSGTIGKIKTLIDNQGNQLDVNTFEPDPSTGNLYIAGNIINNKKNKINPNVNGFSKGIDKGVFTIDIDPAAKNSMKEKYVYWSDGSLEPTINKLAYSKADKIYNVFGTAYRDYKGNTYFVSDAMHKTPRVGAIISSVVFSWTILVPLLEAAGGYNKYSFENTNIFKLTPNGALTKVNTIMMQETSKVAGSTGTGFLPYNRGNYYLTNDESKKTYIIAKDDKNTQIYDTEKGKVIRAVPFSKDGSSMLIAPAKEGYIMVIEKNKKEKYTRLSIERID